MISLTNPGFKFQHKKMAPGGLNTQPTSPPKPYLSDPVKKTNKMTSLQCGTPNSIKIQQNIPQKSPQLSSSGALLQSVLCHRAFTVKQVVLAFTERQQPGTKRTLVPYWARPLASAVACYRRKTLLVDEHSIRRVKRRINIKNTFIIP